MTAYGLDVPDLGLDVSTASERYVRALVRLKSALGPRAAELE